MPHPSHFPTWLPQTLPSHMAAGKSTTTGRLIFELGGIAERELEKLKVSTWHGTGHLCWVAGQQRWAWGVREQPTGRRESAPCGHDGPRLQRLAQEL